MFLAAIFRKSRISLLQVAWLLVVLVLVAEAWIFYRINLHYYRRRTFELQKDPPPFESLFEGPEALPQDFRTPRPNTTDAVLLMWTTWFGNIKSGFRNKVIDKCDFMLSSEVADDKLIKRLMQEYLPRYPQFTVRDIRAALEEARYKNPGRCLVTHNRDAIYHTPTIFFHAPDLKEIYDLPPRLDNHLWVLMTAESPANYHHVEMNSEWMQYFDLSYLIQRLLMKG